MCVVCAFHFQKMPFYSKVSNIQHRADSTHGTMSFLFDDCTVCVVLAVCVRNADTHALRSLRIEK